ncbi:conserved hypothetical protein [Magnetospirillum sp. LM-5]|uniref:pilus assembly protein TadG-related protein n=1 Tax=Magnetospirillum sp. LM-5 TaxID=2681466 RepID=UPI00137F4892|nr:pilus assembly protein TadG-related protein [Magnetospirillum sp. LM-5]CAA7618381.1 conserved hypothetical protein [Magnetospirillum sp. LM-5]
MSSLLRHDGGAVAPLTAITLPVLLGLVGLGVETGMWYADKRVLQVQADAAAMGGAFEVADGGQASSAAARDAARNGFSQANGGSLSVSVPPGSGAYAGDSSAVEVTVSRSRTLLFAGLFQGGDAVTIRARAVARVIQNGQACVLALEGVQSQALYFTGSATINLIGCGVAANSTSAQAMQVSGSATLNTGWVDLVGNYSVSGSGVLNSATVPRTGISPIADPFADLPSPSTGSCLKTGYKSKAHQSETLQPGTYCNGMEIGSQGNVTLSPGTYVVKGGTFKVNGNASLTGSGVTIILSGSGSDYALADINGGASISLTAPSTGAYAGIAFYQDRNAPTGPDNKFNGGSTMNINGAIYFPRQEVKFTGGNATGGGCTRIIAREVIFTGNADMENNCAALGLDTSTTSVRLVE